MLYRMGEMSISTGVLSWGGGLTIEDSLRHNPAIPRPPYNVREYHGYSQTTMRENIAVTYARTVYPTDGEKYLITLATALLIALLLITLHCYYRDLKI